MPELRGVSANAIVGHCKTENPPASRALTPSSAKGAVPSTLQGGEATSPPKGADQPRPHQQHEARDNATTIPIGFCQACAANKSKSRRAPRQPDCRHRTSSTRFNYDAFNKETTPIGTVVAELSLRTTARSSHVVHLPNHTPNEAKRRQLRRCGRPGKPEQGFLRGYAP